MSREEFKDIMEERLELKSFFKKELDTAVRKSKKGKLIPLKDLRFATEA